MVVTHDSSKEFKLYEELLSIISEAYLISNCRNKNLFTVASYLFVDAGLSNDDNNLDLLKYYLYRYQTSKN